MFAQQRRNKHGDLPLSDVATLLEKLGVEREALSAVGLSLGGLARALDTRGRAREAGAVGVDDFCLGLAFLDPLTDAAALWRATDGWGEHTRAMVLRAFDADNDGALAWKEWHRLVAAARARRRHDARKALTYHPKADDGGALAQFANDGGDAAAIERADEAAAWALNPTRTIVSFVRLVTLINVPVPTRVNLAGAESVLRVLLRSPIASRRRRDRNDPDAAGEAHVGRGASEEDRPASPVSSIEEPALPAWPLHLGVTAAARPSEPVPLAPPPAPPAPPPSERASDGYGGRPLASSWHMLATDEVDALVRSRVDLAVEVGRRVPPRARARYRVLPLIPQRCAAPRARRGRSRRSSASSTTNRASSPRRVASSHGSRRRAAASSGWCCRRKPCRAPSANAWPPRRPGIPWRASTTTTTTIAASTTPRWGQGG